jgi:hypothetical protein
MIGVIAWFRQLWLYSPFLYIIPIPVSLATKESDPIRFASRQIGR